MRKLLSYRDTGSHWIDKSKSVSCSVMSDLCNPIGCSLPGSSVRGILQARILEWVAIPFSRGSSQPRTQIQVSCNAGRFFTGLTYFVYFSFVLWKLLYSLSFFIFYQLFILKDVSLYFISVFISIFFIFCILLLCILLVCP